MRQFLESIRMDSEVIMAIDSKEEKDALCRQFVQYMFDRTNEMFKWNWIT